MCECSFQRLFVTDVLTCNTRIFYNLLLERIKKDLLMVRETFDAVDKF